LVSSWDYKIYWFLNGNAGIISNHKVFPG